MKELFLSYLYKLRYDITFRITLIIGAGMAVFMTLMYLGIGALLETKYISGEMMLLSSLSPTQNFGLAIPINLITFTVLEFNQGGIRNKIIAGHSKPKVYASLFLNGLIFTFVMLTVYVLLCFAFGSIFGGFSITGGGQYSEFYIIKMIVSTIFIYIGIVSFTIFFATLFRNIGPAIPVIILTLLGLYLVATMCTLFASDNEGLLWTLRILDPLYPIGATESIENINADNPMMSLTSDMSNETFISGIISNLVYTALFFAGGIIIFTKRDIK